MDKERAAGYNGHTGDSQGGGVLFEERKQRRLYEHHGNFLVFGQDEVILENGKTAVRDFVLHPGAACVLAVNDQSEIIMVRQYRYPVSRSLLEIPAGKLGEGEDPLLCARRELEEETGCRAERWTFLSEYFSAPGFSDERMFLYLASGLSFVESHPDPDEFVRTEKIPASRIREMITEGRIQDAKTLIALLCYLTGWWI
jgi:ADP-ribose pyrophosphatase